MEEGVLNLGGNEMMRRFSFMPREKKPSLIADEEGVAGGERKKKIICEKGCEDHDGP